MNTLSSLCVARFLAKDACWRSASVRGLPFRYARFVPDEEVTEISDLRIVTKICVGAQINGNYCCLMWFKLWNSMVFRYENAGSCCIPILTGALFWRYPAILRSSAAVFWHRDFWATECQPHNLFQTNIPAPAFQSKMTGIIQLYCCNNTERAPFNGRYQPVPADTDTTISYPRFWTVLS